MVFAGRVVLYGGHVIDPAGGIDDDLNVIIEDGKIKEHYESKEDILKKLESLSKSAK